LWQAAKGAKNIRGQCYHCPTCAVAFPGADKLIKHRELTNAYVRNTNTAADTLLLARPILVTDNTEEGVGVVVDSDIEEVGEADKAAKTGSTKTPARKSRKTD